MALLHDLLLHLPEDKRLQILKMDLPSKEMIVVEFVLTQRKELFPTALALRRLEMTQTHFEKVCSVLLRKIIIHFSGKNPIDNINFVCNIQGCSVKILRHQMKLAEKLLYDSDESTALYKRCFEIATRLPVLELDNKEVGYFATRLLDKIDIEKNPEEIADIKAKSLSAAINSMAGSMQIENEDVRKGIERKVLKFIQEVNTSGNHRSIFYAYTVASYFYLVSDQLEKNITICEKLLELIQNKSKEFSERELNESKASYANALWSANRFSEALGIYQELLNYNQPPKTYLLTAHYARFFKLSIITKDFLKAKLILDNTFEKILTQSLVSLRVMASLQYICYYIHTEEFQLAETYIIKAKKDVHRQKLLQYEIQLRYFENALIFLKGNFDEAQLLADKNLKFLRSKNFNTFNSDYSLFFIAIKALYYYVLFKRDFNLKQQRAYDYFFKGSWAHYGGVLEKMKYSKSSISLSQKNSKAKSLSF